MNYQNNLLYLYRCSVMKKFKNIPAFTLPYAYSGKLDSLCICRVFFL